MSSLIEANGTHVAPLENAAMAQVQLEERMFELAQRKANVYAKSQLVPKEYQGNVGNVLIAQNMADRMGADVLMVMQNLYIVHNRPGWSAQFLIATFNSCGRFSAVRYKFTGTPGREDWGCIAYATEKETGETLTGTEVTLRMAKEEGWSTKSGSKWRTMAEQMLRYRSATFFIRSVAPEIGMGLLTKEELEDLPPPAKQQAANRLAEVTQVLMDEPVAIEHQEEVANDDIHQGPAAEDTDQRPAEEGEAIDYAARFAECRRTTDVTDLKSALKSTHPNDLAAIENAAAARLKEIKDSRSS